MRRFSEHFCSDHFLLENGVYKSLLSKRKRVQHMIGDVFPIQGNCVSKICLSAGQNLAAFLSNLCTQFFEYKKEVLLLLEQSKSLAHFFVQVPTTEQKNLFKFVQNIFT